MTLMDLVEEDDGPVVLARRKSRHGDYYEEIPPEPEPTPVPVQPTPVPEPPVWNEQQTALDYIKGLDTALPYMFTSVWPPVQITTNTANWTDGYSISLNDVIASYKGGTLTTGATGTVEGIYAPTYQATQAAMKAADDVVWNQGIIDAITKECGHTYTEGLGQEKFKFNKKRSGGTAVEKVRCVTCGLEFSKERKF